jgi:N-acetylglutamate synthase-like GNAT family acetyltransferase
VNELIPDLRVLNKTDIPEIIDICKTTWNGHDHLPLIIDEWLENTSCHPFVLEQGNRVIGVANVRIIDEGKTAWMEGLRIHSDFRQKGLGERLTLRLVEEAKKLNVKRIRLVTSRDNVAPIKLAAGIGMKQIAKYAVFWKGFRRYPKWVDNSITIRLLESESVILFIQNYPSLIPLNTLIRHWDFFDATRKKIREIGKTSGYLAGANELGAALSLGIKQATSYGTEWCFSLYATNGVSFLSGLSANLKHMREYGYRNLMCIHSMEFTSLYSRISWLKRRNHEIQLVLHELVL